MKKLLIALTFVAMAASAMAQSGFRFESASGLPAVGTSQVSFNNAWIGSAFSYQLTGEDTLSENFLFDINLLYDISFGRWHFPIAGRLGTAVGSGDLSRVDVGIYPWTVLSQSAVGGVLVLHGGIAYTTLPASVLEPGKIPSAIRALVGIEYSHPLGRNNLPLTLSVTPTFRSEELLFGIENLFGLEVTGIIPIAANLGILARVETPFDSALKTSVNAGVIVNGAIGN